MNSIRSFLTPAFRKLYADLPDNVRQLAREKYRLFRNNPMHPSLEFQAKGNVWTVAIGRSYRGIGRRQGDEIHWVWIGSHEAYNTMLQRLKT